MELNLLLLYSILLQNLNQIFIMSQSFWVSGIQEGLAGTFWLRMSHEAAVKLWLVLTVSEDLTGPRGFAWKLTHLAIYWLEAPVSQHMDFSVEVFPPWLLPEWMNRERRGGEWRQRKKERKIDDTTFYDQVFQSHIITSTIHYSVETFTKTNPY